MVQTMERMRISEMNGGRQARGPDWSHLYRIGGIAAVLAAVVTPVTIAVFAAWPPPYDEGAAEWFELLRDNPVLGLVSLDLLFVIVNVLMIPVILSLYVALRRMDPAYVTVAVVTFFVGLAAFFATNPSVEMLSLSGQYADATSQTERTALIGAGDALLASFEGTAFHLNYILGQLAGIALGVVILRSGVFSRPIGWLMVIGNAVGFGLYLPVVGLGLSAFAGAILWIWMILMGRSLLRLSREDRASLPA